MIETFTLYTAAGFVRFKSFTFRLVFGSWLVAYFFVLNFYSGMLTSIMTTTTYNFLATSLEDVVENEKIRPLIIKGSPFFGEITVMWIYL